MTPKMPFIFFSREVVVVKPPCVTVKLTGGDGYVMTTEVSEIWCQHLSVSEGACIFNNNTDFDMKHIIHQCIYTHTLSFLSFVYTNALRGNRVLKRCHHHSLQEAIMERKLIYWADIPASFSPRAAYPLWVIGKIG